MPPSKATRGSTHLIVKSGAKYPASDHAADARHAFPFSFVTLVRR